ncbi:hypothetical protein AC1031_009557, partial [Aphanomyces cochlioides]
NTNRLNVDPIWDFMAHARNVVALPRHVTVLLRVKIGKAFSGNRKDADPPQELAYDTRDESFGVLALKVKDRVTEVVQRYSTSQAASKDKSVLVLNDSIAILLKPSSTAPQTKYLELTETNALSSIRCAWNNYNLKRNGGGDFRLELFVYLEKKSLTMAQIRRGTTDRIDSVRQRILEVDRPVQPGPAALQYISTTTLARQVDEPDIVNLPQNATIHQLNHIDREMERITNTRDARAAEIAQDYRPLRVQMNGEIITLPVNVADFRALAGLPPFALYEPYRPPIVTDPPASNMNDVDHQEHANSSPSIHEF